MRDFRLSVPANLLLVGEYAVTEKGGFGIALAAQPRVLATVSPGASPRIEGIMGGMGFSWDPESGEAPPPLVGACLAACLAACRAAGASLISAAGASLISAAGASSTPGPSSWPFAPARVVIDSSAFFDPDGSKRGLGSSAATAVALVASLLALGGLEDEGLRLATYPLAIAAHRNFQGGRGSGYDVAASCFGGLGLFTGGAAPSWEALGGGAPGRHLSPAALPCLALFRGPRAVVSPEAVSRYQAWRLAHPKAFHDFFAASQTGALALADASSPVEALEALRQAAQRGLELGTAIGVPAGFEMQAGDEGTGAEPIKSPFVIKALGAGNELGIIASVEALDLRNSGRIAGGSIGDPEPLVLEQEGLRWE
ncbi:MAG: hypothetical protein ACOYM2_10640 [Rectinemataceae bacterium]